MAFKCNYVKQLDESTSEIFNTRESKDFIDQRQDTQSTKVEQKYDVCRFHSPILSGEDSIMFLLKNFPNMLTTEFFAFLFSQKVGST